MTYYSSPPVIYLIIFANKLIFFAKSPGDWMRDTAPPFYMGWLVEWLEREGVDLQRLYPPGEVPDTRQGYRHISAPIADYLALTHRVAQLMEDDCIGLRIGNGVDLRDFAYLGQVISYCATLRDCCEILVAYVRSISQQLILQFEEDYHGAALEYGVVGFETELCRHDSDLSLLALMDFFRSCAGEDWSPNRVLLKCSLPARVDDYVQAYGCQVSFDQPRNALLFDAAVLDTPIPRADSAMLKVMLGQVERELARVSSRQKLVADVRREILLTIGSKQCMAPEIATRLHVSQRTLNRTLQQLGTSFRALKSEVIAEIAKAALSESGATVTEISVQLGYSDVAAFDHAFYKLTGFNPRDYRTRARRRFGAGPDNRSPGAPVSVD